MKELKLSFFIILSVLFLDITSKFLTHSFLPHMSHSSIWFPYGGIAVFKNFFGIEFSISHATNFGAAWGLFSQYQIPLLILRMVLVAGLVSYLFFFKKPSMQQIFLSLIVAGAIGNVLDYFTYGHVVDMLHFVFFGYNFPVFNIADSAIFIGVSGYLINSTLCTKPA